MATYSDRCAPLQAPVNARDWPVDTIAGAFGPLQQQFNHLTQIFDIRRGHKDSSLVRDIERGLNDSHSKELPTLLLYNQRGLQLFQSITYLQEYYLTNEEIAVLQEHADAIAHAIPSNAILLELGSGNLRKVTILLSALEQQRKRIEYYALDLDLQELERTLAEVPHYEHVQCFGLWGTYDDGLAWLKMPQTANKPKVVMSLGSSIGNFHRQDSATFIRDYADAVGEAGALLIGVDSCLDPMKVHKAYNDSQGITRRFTLNGLTHANELLGKDEFDVKVWDAVGRYDEAQRRHEAFVLPNQDTSVLGVAIRAGEEVRIEQSHKYSATDLQTLWKKAHVKQLSTFSNRRGDYAMHLVSKKRHALPWDPKDYASHPVPAWSEWQDLWQLWDTVTRQMIPDEELLGKPIKLRNACIFYLGHIPTFFDMKLTDTTHEPPTEPKYFYRIFERGIDPDVDNPEQCHAHSEVPDQWPPLVEILTFQKRVRERVQTLYEKGASQDSKVGRCLWLGYEHEAMHLETLLYMLIQSEKTLPPTGAPVPVWNVQANDAGASAVANQWFDIPERDIVLNMDDPEDNAPPERYFGWDVEKPSRKAHVAAFQAKARPITNEEYAQYLVKTGGKDLPASWAETSGGSNAENGLVPDANIKASSPASFLSNKYVRTVFGAVSLADALTWPVCASYDELAGCASYMGGRIPTLEEARSIYAYAQDFASQSGRAAEQRLASTIPAVNSHLVNEGVEESPPSGSDKESSVDSPPNPHELFVNLKGCNVGFQHWHPTPVVQNGNRLSGQANMGGVWEWTSTPLTKHPGFEPMPLYPAYSRDFFDDKHNIVLGGSWATVPRIAGRRTFVNWYQRNYRYVWAGARLVKDA